MLYSGIIGILAQPTACLIQLGIILAGARTHADGGGSFTILSRAAAALPFRLNGISNDLRIDSFRAIRRSCPTNLGEGYTHCEEEISRWKLDTLCAADIFLETATHLPNVFGRSACLVCGWTRHTSKLICWVFMRVYILTKCRVGSNVRVSGWVWEHMMR